MSKYIPLCCWPRELAHLVQGLVYGWIIVILHQPRGLRGITWKAWYWPGYVHPFRFGVECSHGAKPESEE